MMQKIKYGIFSLLCAFSVCIAVAQPNSDELVDKPESFEKKKLRSEKTDEKKWNWPNKLIQNTSSRYNYYFNTNEKLKMVLERATNANKDDYTQLLKFYPYSLESTATFKSELDSIIYKSTAGILLHDLRSNWVDDFYFLIGRAYYLRNDMDSAGRSFQFINFSFAPKDKSGDSDPVGSNASETGIFSISTPEKRNFLQKLFSKAPSRNDAFLWQVRTLTNKKEFPEAAGILEIIKHDPNFPKRLQLELNEVTAYWYYMQEQYDSAANFLSQALKLAPNKMQLSRWEYLLGQMYAMTNQKALASKYFALAQDHTFDPVMDVYARINSIRLNQGNNAKYIDENLSDIEKMAKKDKYENYRNIIYYAAANIALEKPDTTRALNYLNSSNQFNFNNTEQKTKNYLLKGDLHFAQKDFTKAKDAYDSIDLANIKDSAIAQKIKDRKPALEIIAANLKVIQEQDSLQALASMTKEMRDALVKKKLKELRKAQGLKEEESNTGGAGPALLNDPNAPAVDLFSSGKKGDFYFYDGDIKARGFNEFKTRWGNRQNVDNWRRSAAVANEIKRVEKENLKLNDDRFKNDTTAVEPLTNLSEDELTFENLLAKIPLTDSGMQASMRKKREAQFKIGKAAHNQIEDYYTAIDYYEKSLNNEVDTLHNDEMIFGLIYCYTKIGDMAKADYYKNLLKTKYANSKFNNALTNPGNFKTDNQGNTVATAAYKNIYDLFLSGQFDEALAKKKLADSLYGKHYWTPQLLYIQSIYHIKQRQDSLAVQSLNQIQSQFPSNPIAAKAATMIDVLNHRADIERYLTNLKIDSNQLKKDAPPVVVNNTQPKPNVINTQPVRVRRDTIAKPTVQTNAPTLTKPNANVVIKKDSLPKPNVPAVVLANYAHKPELPHSVLIVLDKVDPVYIGEAKNAFNRYNKSTFYNQTINMRIEKLDDRYSIVVMEGFANALAALEYVDKTKPKAAREIVSWLDQAKFSFLIISIDNMQILQSRKDLKTYTDFLKLAIPNKF